MRSLIVRWSERRRTEPAPTRWMRSWAAWGHEASRPAELLVDLSPSIFVAAALHFLVAGWTDREAARVIGRQPGEWDLGHGGRAGLPDDLLGRTEDEMGFDPGQAVLGGEVIADETLGDLQPQVVPRLLPCGLPRRG